MTVFADSSAILKLYVEESESDEVRELSVLVVSSICRVEVSSAIMRKVRNGELGQGDAAVLIREFESDLADLPGSRTRYVTVPISTVILERAAQLVQQQDLRSLDSIQLASALNAREVDPDCVKFACFDRQLGDAALAHGFKLISSS